MKNFEELIRRLREWRDGRAEIDAPLVALGATPDPRIETLDRAIEALEGMGAAMQFAGRVLDAHRDHIGDVDGGELQDWAVEFGLLERRTVTEPCGENCDCACVSEFPLECNFLSDAGRAAIDESRKVTAALDHDQPIGSGDA